MSRHTDVTTVEIIHRILVTKTIFNILPFPSGDLLLKN